MKRGFKHEIYGDVVEKSNQEIPDSVGTLLSLIKNQNYFNLDMPPKSVVETLSETFVSPDELIFTNELALSYASDDMKYSKGQDFMIDHASATMYQTAPNFEKSSNEDLIVLGKKFKVKTPTSIINVYVIKNPLPTSIEETESIKFFNCRIILRTIRTGNKTLFRNTKISEFKDKNDIVLNYYDTGENITVAIITSNADYDHKMQELYNQLIHLIGSSESVTLLYKYTLRVPNMELLLKPTGNELPRRLTLKEMQEQDAKRQKDISQTFVGSFEALQISLKSYDMDTISKLSDPYYLDQLKEVISKRYTKDRNEVNIEFKNTIDKLNQFLDIINTVVLKNKDLNK